MQYNDKSVITIHKNGTPVISPLEELQNDHVYKGIENDLILSQVYTTSFTCEYDMAGYPFDNQKCSMIFTMQVKDLIAILVTEKVRDVLSYRGTLETLLS